MNGTRASARGKRKASTAPDESPPSKRPINGKVSETDLAVDLDDTAYVVEVDDVQFSSLPAPPAAGLLAHSPATLGEWQDTIHTVVRNVVAIRFCQTCSFDTDPALTSEATGFVVDAERG